MEQPRVGVFVCHCGTNIGGFVDVPSLVEQARELPNVVFACDNLYTCSDSGRVEIGKAIKEQGLTRVVVASCTPRTHEPLFRATCQDAGLNPYLFELANIRDQCSWVHMNEKEKATIKAMDLIRMSVARASLLEPRDEIEVDVVPNGLVIGGGIAGMTAALSLANRGFEMVLVEREAQLGGLLNKVRKLYPGWVDAHEFIAAKVEQVQNNPRIQVLTEAQVNDVAGFVGNYDVSVEQGGQETRHKVGAIIVATGAIDLKPVGLYGYDGKRVVTQSELENLLEERDPSGSTLLGSVVMIQCAGARNAERPYCSRICCMTAVKNALRIKSLEPDAQVYVLYRDMMTLGTDHEDLYREARGRGILFLEYSPEAPPVVKDGHVEVYNETLQQNVRIPADLTVLSVPLISQPGTLELAQHLKVPVDSSGFFLEAHVKLRPLDFATDGIYLCGSAHWPADIGDSVSQAHGAAGRASILLGRGAVKVEPAVSSVDEDLCIGCGLCEAVCPYNAIVLQDTEMGRKAATISASCKGCGVCGAGCPARAITMEHFTNQQIHAQIDALLEAVA
jgi:heterodisulfide reductase subunit A2